MSGKVSIPWARLGYGPEVPGVRRVLVICEVCKAPIGVLDTPTDHVPSNVVGAWAEALARLALPHGRQHPGGHGEVRVNLVEADRLDDPGVLDNLLGRDWYEVLKGLNR